MASAHADLIFPAPIQPFIRRDDGDAAGAPVLPGGGDWQRRARPPGKGQVRWRAEAEDGYRDVSLAVLYQDKCSLYVVGRF